MTKDASMFKKVDRKEDETKKDREVEKERGSKIDQQWDTSIGGMHNNSEEDEDDESEGEARVDGRDAIDLEEGHMQRDEPAEEVGGD